MNFIDGSLFVENMQKLVITAAPYGPEWMPSDFPEDGSAPLYHGADVSLWFVHAVHQYLRRSGDGATVRRSLYEPVERIIEQGWAVRDLNP